VASYIKKEEESKPFTAGQHETLEAKLHFCLYSDLFKIIKDNWSLFKDVFGKDNLLETYRKFVIDARNKFKHGNTPNNIDLASAEAGLLWLEECLNAVLMEEENAVGV